MRQVFSKLKMLLGLLTAFGAKSSKEFKATEEGKKSSLSRYSEDNFGNLPMKRIKGKWRIKR